MIIFNIQTYEKPIDKDKRKTVKKMQKLFVLYCTDYRVYNKIYIHLKNGGFFPK